MLEWHSSPAQAAREIIAGSGGEYCERSSRIYWCRKNLNVIIELKKAFGRFAQCTVAANHCD